MFVSAKAAAPGLHRVGERASERRSYRQETVFPGGELTGDRLTLAVACALLCAMHKVPPKHKDKMMAGKPGVISGSDRWINRGERYWPTLKLDRIASHYRGVYVGDFAIRQRDGTWSDIPVSVFFVEFPSKPEFSNYVGFYIENGTVMVCNAASVADGSWPGMLAPNGEVVFTRYRHDYRKSEDGVVFIDGGREMTHGGGSGTYVKVSVVRDNLVVNDVLMWPVREPKSGRI